MQPYTFPLAVGPSSTMSLTTTLTNIPGISVNVAAGKYLVKGWIQYTTTGTTATVSAAVGGTATTVAPTAYSLTIRNNNTSDSANLQVSAVVPGVANPSGTLATAGVYASTLDGLVTVSAAGTLTLMAKIGAATASIAVNGAAMLVQQIA